MRLRTTLWLLFWCLVLALCVQVTRRQEAAGGSASSRLSRQLLDLSGRPPLAIVLLSANSAPIECRRSSPGAEWRVVRPIEDRADHDQVDRILGALESAAVRERISPEQRHARGLRFADYGLSRPSHRMVIDDGVRRRIVMTGVDSPLGDAVYVRVVGEPDVIAVSRELKAVLQPAVSDLRERSVLRGAASSSMRVEIDRPQGGFVQLVRMGGRWMLQQPISARADNSRVEALIEAVFASRVERYVWDPPAGSTGAARPVALPADDRLEPYGLGVGEVLRLTVWGVGADSRQELLLGKAAAENPDWVYAKRGDSPSILAVPRATRETLAAGVADLRDHQVFPFAGDAVRQVHVTREDRRLTLVKRPDSGWVLTDPIQAKADDVTVQAAVDDLLRWRAAAFINAPVTNLAEWGLAPPAWTVRVSTRVPTAAAAEPAAPAGEPAPGPEMSDASRPATVTLAAGAVGPSSNLLYAAVQGAGAFLAVPAAVALHPALHPENALLFRDRTVLAVPSERIQKFTRSAAGAQGEESVARDAEGAWTRTEPEERRPDREAVNNLLFCVSNLRALRVESQAADDLSAYGLERPALTVTLRLSGEAGIRKTLLLGGAATGGGAYAMVQGQDAIYVLDAETVGVLRAALTRASAGAAGPEAVTGVVTGVPPSGAPP